MIPEEPISIAEKETNINTRICDFSDIEKCAEWIEAQELNKVCLQFPDNLLEDCVNVVTQLERRLNKKLYILGDTSYGSCCVDDVAAQHIDADAVIHFGHACLHPTLRLPVFHILPKNEIDTRQLIENFRSQFQDQDAKILFFYDIGYAHTIEHISLVLRPLYKSIVFTSLNCTSNVPFTDTKNNSSPVVLGRCFELENAYSVEDYEAFFFGDGGKTFVTLTLGIQAKRWYYYDSDTIVPFEAMNNPWLKRRRFLVEKLKDAKVVGIVVATLGINGYLKAITMLKNIFKEKNIKSYILSVGKVNPTKLANFPEIDVFVLITCPENEVLESRDFLKPLLLPYEVELAFNTARMSYTEYCIDFTQILPGGRNYKEFKPSADSDISLITGELRTHDFDAPCANAMNALVIKSPGAVATVGKAGAQYLQDRSWKGVEQRLGKDPVRPATAGRSGLAAGYENEPVSKDTKNGNV